MDLPPRERDVAVAVLRGWEWVTEDEEQVDYVPYLIDPQRDSHGTWYPKIAAQFPNVPSAGGWLPFFTSDIVTAWELVEDVDPAYAVTVFREPDGSYSCTIYGHAHKTTEGQEYEGLGDDSAPLAISIAYMKVRGAIE